MRHKTCVCASHSFKIWRNFKKKKLIASALALFLSLFFSLFLSFLVHSCLTHSLSAFHSRCSLPNRADIAGSSLHWKCRYQNTSKFLERSQICPHGCLRKQVSCGMSGYTWRWVNKYIVIFLNKWKCMNICTHTTHNKCRSIFHFTKSTYETRSRNLGWCALEWKQKKLQDDRSEHENGHLWDICALDRAPLSARTFPLYIKMI